jgi:CRISPR type III-A/MTUBE-associated protein Csm6
VLRLNNYILFSLVGSSDPIRDFHDGPMLHICRVYKPKKVYLLYTDEMCENDEIDNRYERSVKELVDEKIEVLKIFTDIKDPHKFETFFVPIKENIDKIKAENPEDDILVNITSGTAQFIGALAMFLNYADYKIKPVQVTTPSKSSNISETVKKEYELEDIMELNEDNKENYIDRTLEPDLNYYNRLIVKSQLKKLVESYQYMGGIELLKTYSKNYQKISTLLRFADMRMKLAGSEANEKLNIFNSKEVKNIKYAYNDRVPEWYSLIEYYNVLKTKSDIGDYASYVIMMEPLSIKIYQIVLKYLLNKNLRKIFEFRGGQYYIVPNRLDINLKKYLEEKLGSKINEGYIGDILWINTVKYYINLKKEDSLKEDFKNIVRNFKNIKPIRNEIAHGLISITKEDFIKKVGISPEIVNNGIELFLINHLKIKGFSKNMFNLYEEINDKIFELLDQEV